MSEGNNRTMKIRFWVTDFDLRQLPIGTNISLIKISYLRKSGGPGAEECTVRKVSHTGKDCEYYYGQQSAEFSARQKEMEIPITAEEYQSHIASGLHLDRAEISKIRFEFKDGDQVFAIDMNNGKLHGLAIMDVEVSDTPDRFAVRTPPFFKLLNVTDDQQFSDSHMAEHGLPLAFVKATESTH
ncbi:MAG: hypothetical protein K9M11_00940 [Candidatus Pacebacteria bacterium]|nr:hypothetical protein [Candidatus Paceibacterota bacterium]